MIGTPIAISFNLESQLPLDSKYLKDGVPYASTSEVLATIPIGSRSPGLPVLIGTVLYWFLADLTTLEPVVGTLTISDGSVTLVKMAAMDSLTVLGNATGVSATPQMITIAALKVLLGLTGTNSGDQDLSGKVDKVSGKGLSTEDFTSALLALLNQQSGTNTGDETLSTILTKLGITTLSGINTGDQDLSGLVVKITGSSLVADTEIARLLTLKQNIYQINLPAGDLATKIAGATFSPAGWATIAVNSSVNAMITHVLTGRKVSFVNVFEIDGSDESLLSFDKGTAYTGIKGNGLTVLISGIAPTSLAVRVELIFD